jgi:hypothetical protein
MADYTSRFTLKRSASVDTINTNTGNNVMESSTTFVDLVRSQLKRAASIKRAASFSRLYTNSKASVNVTNHDNVTNYVEHKDNDIAVGSFSEIDPATNTMKRLNSRRKSPQKISITMKINRNLRIDNNVAVETNEKQSFDRISHEKIQKQSLQILDTDEFIKRPLQRRRSNYDDEFTKRENDRLKAREMAANLIRAQKLKKEFSESKGSLATSGRKLVKRNSKRLCNDLEKNSYIPVQTVSSLYPDATPKIRLHTIVSVVPPTISQQHRPTRLPRRLAESHNTF